MVDKYKIKSCFDNEWMDVLCCSNSKFNICFLLVLCIHLIYMGEQDVAPL